jgi:outer membrane autotransporter protein
LAALRLGGPLAFAGADEISTAFAYAKSPIVTKAPQMAPVATSDMVFWAQSFGALGRLNSDGNAASVTRNLAGFVSGVDTRFGANGRAGLAAGYSGSQNNLDGRGSANIDTGHLAAYGGWSIGVLNLRGGADYAFHAIATDRTIAFPGFFDRAFANYDGSTGQVFGEAGYGFALANLAFEPFAGAAWVRVHTDSGVERATAAGLNFARANFEVGYSTLGIRVASIAPLANGMVLMPRASVAWQHTFGSLVPNDVLAFQAAPTVPFTISGVPIARDATLVEAGLDFALNAHATVGISYNGQLASSASDHAVKGKFNWRF